MHVDGEGRWRSIAAQPGEQLHALLSELLDANGMGTGPIYNRTMVRIPEVQGKWFYSFTDADFSSWASPGRIKDGSGLFIPMAGRARRRPWGKPIGD
jgi:hypothetical protein